MSSEYTFDIKSIETPKIGLKVKNDQSITSNRVDINTLMSRVREEKKKEKREGLVFFGLIGSVVIITGIIASL